MVAMTKTSHAISKHQLNRRVCAQSQPPQTGIVIEVARRAMLVEGGYLHSMKRLLETAAQTPEPNPALHAKRKGGILTRSLRRLGGLLFGWAVAQ